MDSSRAVATLRSLRDLTGRIPLTSISKALPKLGKLLICFIFLLNIRSWPFVWHLRVFRPVFYRRFHHAWIRFLMLFKSSRLSKLKLEDAWLDSITPVGANPFTTVVPYKTWASIDESDFNGHLSNSSYAKTLDGARFKCAVDLFPMFFRTGGWIALAATHYHFIREIPMLSSYEVRSTIAAWDQKWLYVMSKFVRTPDGKKKPSRKSRTPPPGGDGQIMALRTPGSEAISSSVTPLPLTKPQSGSETESALKAVAAGLAREEPDGAIVHTIVISQVCYKIGRITVPPGIILGVNGFTGSEGHSLTAPHPQWASAKKVMSRTHGGSPRKLKEFLAGGWREAPENERWWEQALGDDVEAQRVRNLALIEGLRFGMENARAV